MKSDLEGGARAVLGGASLVFTKFRPIFVCEVLDAKTQAWGYNARETNLMLQNYGFSWFEICFDGSIVPHQIKDHYPEIQNYVAVPKEKCTIG